MPNITIDVTQQDIDRAVRFSCGDCPIALAARRSLGNMSVFVTKRTMLIRRLQYTCDLISLPTDAVQFVSDFDERRPVSPFRFSITV